MKNATTLAINSAITKAAKARITLAAADEKHAAAKAAWYAAEKIKQSTGDVADAAYATVHKAEQNIQSIVAGAITAAVEKE